MKIRDAILATITGTFIAAAVALGFQFGAVDTAGAPVSPSQAQALHASGVNLFIQSLTWWPSCSKPTTQPSTRIPSLEAAQSVGMDTAGYLLMDPYTDGAALVDRARDGVPDQVWNALTFVAIDFEIPTECYATGTRITIDQIQQAADRLVALGKPCVIYTSYGEWGSRLSPPNAPHPIGCYLWEASWDNNPDVDFSKHPFGGWLASDVVVEQYNGGSQVAGVYVDLDSLSINGPFPWQTPVVIQPQPEWCCDVQYWGPLMGTSRYHSIDDAWYWGIPQADGREFLYKWVNQGPWVCVSGCP